MHQFTLLDGGMGKALAAQGAPFRQPEWSALALMEAPDEVLTAHRRFIEAGAEVIITNNYAVVPFHIGADRFAERGHELTDLAGQLARQAADEADRPVIVAGSIPPLFGSYQPESFDPDAAPDLLRLITNALAPHVDLFLPETQSSLAEATASIAAAQPHGLPIWLAVTLEDEPIPAIPVLRSGESISDAVACSTELGCDALLFNCSRPEAMEAAIERATSQSDGGLAIGAYANAFPSIDRTEYAANEVILEHRSDLDDEGYRDLVESWLEAGATIVGGCCGIMPHHIAELAEIER